MSASVDNLLEILGPRVTRAHAEKLLADADADIPTAVALHFSAAQSSSLPPLGGGSGPSRELGELRSVLGSGPSHEQLEGLLRLSRGSVQAAIEMYFDNPQAGVPPAAAGGPGGSHAGGAANASYQRAAAVQGTAGGASVAANGEGAGGDGGDGVALGAAPGPSGTQASGEAPAPGRIGPGRGGTPAAGQRLSAAIAAAAPHDPDGEESDGDAGPGPSGAGGRPGMQQRVHAQARGRHRLPAQYHGQMGRPSSACPSSQLLDGDMLNRVKRTQGPYPVAPLLPLPQFRRSDGTLHLTQQDKVPEGPRRGKALSRFRWPMLLGQVLVPLKCELGALYEGATATGAARTAGAAAVATDKQQATLLEMALRWIAKGKLNLPVYRGGNHSEYASEVYCEVEWARSPAQPGESSRYGPRLVLSVANTKFQKKVKKKFPGVVEQQQQQQRQQKESGDRYFWRQVEDEVRLAVSAVGGPMQDVLYNTCLNDAKRNAGVSLTRSEARALMINMRIFGPNLDPVNGQVFKLDFRPGSTADNKQQGGEEVEATAEDISKRGRKRAKITRAEETGHDAISKAKTKAGAKGKARSKGTHAAGPAAASRTVATTATAAAASGAVAAAGAVAASGAAAPATPSPLTGYHLQLEFYLDPSMLQATAPPPDLYNTDSEVCTRRGSGAGSRNTTYLASVIDLVLRMGSGLYVGPDCDGGINTGDVDGPELQQGPVAGPSGSSAAAGPSNAAGTSAAAGVSTVAAAVGASTSSGTDAGTLNVDALLDAIQPPTDLPKAVAPHSIKTHPLPFQLQGLEWLLRRERQGEAVGRSVLLLHPAWAQVVVGSSGLVLHVHRLMPHFVTPDFFPSPVGGTCGGFLCDEMGLGKSLQMLMLIAANPPPPDWPAKPVPITDATAAGGSGSGSAVGTSQGSSAGSSPLGRRLTALLEPADREEPVAIPTTLLVVPGNLKNQWVEEIKRHVLPGKLKWAVYRGYKDSAKFSVTANTAAMADVNTSPPEGRGARRAAAIKGKSAHVAHGKAGNTQKLLPLILARSGNGSMVPVHECDLVLVTYELLRAELGGISKRLSEMLLRLGFWRIVLDEAQLVANSNSVAALVASSLYRRHAWVVTGTPISSSLNEVQGLCQFLSYEPYMENSIWRKLLYGPFVHRSPMGIAALRALLQGVMLRRSREAVEDQLFLPPCRREEIIVDLTAVERVFYDVQKARYLAALAAVKTSSSTATGSSAAAATAEDAAGSSPTEASWRPGGRRVVEDPRKSSSIAYHRALAALVELRQCCCHPHIVRREALAAQGQSARAARGKHTAPTEGADAPRSYRQIMAKLVSDAYGAYDQAVAGVFGSRIQLAALQDYKAASNPAQDASLTAGAAGPSGTNTAAAATPVIIGTSALAVQLEMLQNMEKVVSETDLRFQARARAADGGIIWERAKTQTVAFGGAPEGSGLAGVAPFLASEQARERKRRWQRLQLDVHMLRCYLACLQAPLGTLPLLATRAAARVADDAHNQAVEKAKAAAEEVRYRTSRYEELAEELHGMLQGRAAAAAMEEDGADGSSKESVEAAKRDGGKGGKEEEGCEGTEKAEAVSRAMDRVKTAARLMSEAKGKAETALAAESVAAEVAMAALVATGVGAAPSVLEAAAEIARLHEHVNELRVRLGLEPVDLMEADTALRRSQRQIREAVGQPAGAEGAGGSAGGVVDAQTAAVSASARTATGKRPLHECSGGSSEDDDDDDDDGGSSSSDEEHLRKKRARKERTDKRMSGGAREHEGALVALGGTPYQEALFRMEAAVRTFQNLADRKGASAKIESDQFRLLQAASEKWHALQHLLNQQEEQGLADDPPGCQQQQLPVPQLTQPPSAAATNGPAASKTDAAATATAAAAAAAAAGGPSGSSAMPGAAVAAAAGNGSSAGAPDPAPIAPAPAAAKDEFSCPICLDVAERRTITTCGHTYCTDCIHDIVQGKGTAPCPICRRQLTRADLHDSSPDAEAVDLDAMLPAELPPKGTTAGEYGAKVTALLMELERMSEEDPHSKALVFSSWGRLLRMVQEGLNANGIRCASLVGGNPERRQAALNTFLHDPNCRVLLLMKSTSGGAAGLTLTVAHTAFMMEPAVNPGLEAQAAARICRLGQDRPTRVVRIIARNTVEERVLALQQHKLQLGEALPRDGEAGSEAVDGCLLVRFFDNL